MKLLHSEGIQAILIVEPQDYKAYEDAWNEHGIIQLEKDDHGLAFARQHVLEHASRTLTVKQPWFWMLDDDIKGIYQRDTETRRCVKSTFRAMFKELNPIIQASQDAQASIEYQQFAWSTTTAGKKNSYCDVAVAINATKAYKTAHYRTEMVLKEDRDFTLQLITSGYSTFRYQRWAFSAPRNGSNEGGLRDLYDEKGREAEAVKRMAKAWPGIVTKQEKKDGRIDCKINWKLFS